MYFNEFRFLKLTNSYQFQNALLYGENSNLNLKN